MAKSNINLEMVNCVLLVVILFLVVVCCYKKTVEDFNCLPLFGDGTNTKSLKYCSDRTTKEECHKDNEKNKEQTELMCLWPNSPRPQPLSGPSPRPARPSLRPARPP